MKGYLKLAGILFGLWIFIWVVTPFWVSFSPEYQRIAQVHEENDIPTGALYYNDLKFMTEAAMTLRDTWRFLPKGPQATLNATRPSATPDLAPEVAPAQKM